MLGSFYNNVTSEVELLCNAKTIIDNCIVGVTEYFSDFMRAVSKAVGVSLPNLHDRNHKTVYSELNEREVIYSQTAHFFHSDYLIYEYAKSVFLERNRTIYS